LVSCPKCGTEVATPVKTWPIPSRRPLTEGEKPKFAAIFECPNCKARFRAAAEAEARVEETASMTNMLERTRGAKGETTQTLASLREKIKTLETERADLMIEIEKLKRGAESKMNTLENEVSMLRDEAKSLRNLLGYAEEEK
jgi:chromosome segregation ATPase